MALDYLVENGFEIVERNYRCKIGEIDIIALKDNIIRFIEVKYRSSSDFGYALQAVSKTKQAKIIRVAQWFMKEHNMNEDIQCSFDVIAIQGNNVDYIFNSYGAM